MLELFDLANPNECYRRRESVVPQQALAMINSAVALDQSRLLARRLSRQVGETSGPPTSDKFITAAFECILSRSPTHKELAACLRFLEGNSALLKETAKLTVFPPGGQSKVAPEPKPHASADQVVRAGISHADRRA